MVPLVGKVSAVSGHGNITTIGNGVSERDCLANRLAVVIEVDERVRGVCQTDAAVVEPHMDTTGMAPGIVAIARLPFEQVRGAKHSLCGHDIASLPTFHQRCVASGV